MDQRTAHDLAQAVEQLAARLPDEMAPFAELAYNLWWSWSPGGAEAFRDIDPYRWELSGHNPVRLLSEAPRAVLRRVAEDHSLHARAAKLLAAQRSYLSRPARGEPLRADRPAAFLCTEYALHTSLPIYAGGLGVLAGDILKECSDQAIPMVGVGLLYRQGYFHQRLDPAGWQHEYWLPTNTDHLPAVLVSGPDGTPLTVTVAVLGREVTAQMWQVCVGRVPLYLLDTYHPDNTPVDQWITSRLYTGDRAFRLAQYAFLGLGGMRALHALDIEPGVVHLNEGHAALAALELVHEHIHTGHSFDESIQLARERIVFTTHTPVAAGNETYSASEVRDVLGDSTSRFHVDIDTILDLGRSRPGDESDPFGVTPLGIRLARRSGGVSRLHGSVARGMWRHLFETDTDDDVPIGHVTNGVHVPTWMAAPMRSLLDQHLRAGWTDAASDPSAWEGVDQIPDEQLWAVRSRLRADLVMYARNRTILDRLSRGDSYQYAEGARHAFDPEVLTIGFARRAAAYKRLYLLALDPVRALSLLSGPNPIQVLLSGKPHPQDDEGKAIIQGVFSLRMAPEVGGRAAYLEDYNLSMAKILVAGCDVWVNVPRPPMEACGTSGMKAALNGGLNLSVLDGWWDEGFDGSNGWAIRSDPTGGPEVQDARDAAALYDLLEREVIPLFHDRGNDGVPHGWIGRIKHSIRTIGPQFSAARMMRDYVQGPYAG